MFFSFQCALLASTFLSLIVSGQVLDSLPIDDGTKKYLESLPSDQLEAILKIYGEATAGQVPASADIIEAQELRWSYNHSPPFYPTRKCPHSCSRTLWS
jgi:beta-glucosidase